MPEPSAPGAVPGFRLLLRACGRTLHPRLVRTTNPPVRESSPAPATCLSLSLSLFLSFSISLSICFSSVSLYAPASPSPSPSPFLSLSLSLLPLLHFPLSISLFLSFTPLRLLSFPPASCLTLSHPLHLFLRSSIYPHPACAYSVHLRPQTLATLRDHCPYLCSKLTTENVAEVRLRFSSSSSSHARGRTKRSRYYRSDPTSLSLPTVPCSTPAAHVRAREDHGCYNGWMFGSMYF